MSHPIYMRLLLALTCVHFTKFWNVNIPQGCILYAFFYKIFRICRQFRDLLIDQIWWELLIGSI